MDEGECFARTSHLRFFARSLSEVFVDGVTSVQTSPRTGRSTRCPNASSTLFRIAGAGGPFARDAETRETRCASSARRDRRTPPPSTNRHSAGASQRHHSIAIASRRDPRRDEPLARAAGACTGRSRPNLDVERPRVMDSSRRAGRRLPEPNVNFHRSMNPLARDEKKAGARVTGRIPSTMLVRP